MSSKIINLHADKELNIKCIKNDKEQTNINKFSVVDR